MCGIIGYTGRQSALSILIRGLHALEYRGYDSAGVAVGDSSPRVIKSRGRISVLEEKISSAGTDFSEETRGIAHTRWATHGEPSDTNSHPHETDSLILVHNGIIENYASLARELTSEGYSFRSETDTEVAACLIDREYKRLGNAEKAIFSAKKLISGSFAFGIIFKDIPEKIYAIRRQSPLIAAKTENGSFIASDITAIIGETNEYTRPDEELLLVLTKDNIEYLTEEGTAPPQKEERVDFNATEAQKGGYPHFMLKEIYETPDSIRKTISAYTEDGYPHFSSPILDSDMLRDVGTVHIAACGTAMHAGLVGKRMIEKYARIPVNVEIASEFRYRNPIMKKDDLMILLSQSGETADTLAALRHAKCEGVTTLAIVNVYGSSIASEADYVLYTKAGPEIAVASTKAYAVQCTLLSLIALRLAEIEGKLTREEIQRELSLLMKTPTQTEEVHKDSDHLKNIAKKLMNHEHIFYIGRGIDADACTEGSLKLKEISYIHSESYAAGELKHGTISLIEEGVPVIAVATDPALFEKTVNAMREVKSRGAYLTVLTTETLKKSASFPADEVITVPGDAEIFNILPAVSALQLLAYHVSAEKGYDVDKPRNLAKSVTVE